MALMIRPASAEDADDLATLAREAFRRTYEGLIDAATVDAVVAQTCSRDAFLRLLAAYEQEGLTSRLLVATEDAALLGFLDFAEEDDGLELRRLYTRVGRTGRGVGAALLSALEGGLPSGTRYRIVVMAQNLCGLRFWERHGFRVRGDVDGMHHFRTHRGVTFESTAAAPRLLVLDRTVGTLAPDGGSEGME